MNKLNKPCIDFSNECITAYDNEEYYTLLEYIEDFCNLHGISYKFVGESITIYPADYNKINVDKIDLNKVYVSLLNWVENNTGFDNNYKITSMYWVYDKEPINSLEDLEKLLLKIHNTKQKPEVYYTDEEISEKEKKYKLCEKKTKKEDKKRKEKFSKTCKELNISEKDFFKLLEAYKQSHNKSFI